MDAVEFSIWARSVQNALGRDVLVFRGEVWPGVASMVFAKVATMRRRRDVTLLLRTEGGSKVDATRIARDLRKAYCYVTVVVMDYCESEGTILLRWPTDIALAELGEIVGDMTEGNPSPLSRARWPTEVEEELAAVCERLPDTVCYLDEARGFFPARRA